jgi:hypothetical protein
VHNGQRKSPTPDQLGGETGNRAEEHNPHTLIGDARKRLDRYGTAKAATLRVLDTVGDSAARDVGIRVEQVRKCGDWLLFRHFPTLKETKLQSANFCSTHLICGFCAIRRGARMMARYLERFQWVRATHPELNPYLVTFTVRNGVDLQERLLHLERCLTRLHKRRHGKRSRSLLTEIAGAVWSYEVTYSDEKGWHPHVHAVYLAKEQPNEQALRAEWHEITGDSFMCDVRPIEADANATSECDPHAKGFAEVFKYALKAAELPAKQAIQAFKFLKGRRLVRSFGEFFGVVEPANRDLADEMPDSDLPYIDLLWRYAGGRYEHCATYERNGPGSRGSDGPHLSPEQVHLAPGDLRRPSGGAQQCGANVRRRVEKQSAKSAGQWAPPILRAV